MFSSYILSIKMDGPVAEGDGVIMVSTGKFNRGAIAIVLNNAADGIETY